jgi:hypothetical protein
MPRGTPFNVWASVVCWRRRCGCTKLSTTRFTEGRPSPRSISQWFFASNSATLRTVLQVQKSLPQCQAPYSCTGEATCAEAEAPASRAAAKKAARSIAYRMSVLRESL